MSLHNFVSMNQTFSNDQYAIRLSEAGDGIVVSRDEQPQVTCTISLTSPLVKDEPSDVGNYIIFVYDTRRPCLNGLDCVRL